MVGSSEERRRGRGREQKCESVEENLSWESCGLSGSVARGSLHLAQVCGLSSRATLRCIRACWAPLQHRICHFSGIYCDKI